MRSGVLYTATGSEYVEQAIVSIRSLRRWNDEVGVAVFTDDPKAFDGIADVVSRIEYDPPNPQQRMLPRLRCLLETPFERTLALDTDTIIMGPLDDLFMVLDRVSVGICHGHQRARRFSAALRDQKALSDIPYSFAPVQGGVILYDDVHGREFVQDVVDLYQHKQYIDDQVSMREVLWKADYRFAFLGPEYNTWELSTLDAWAASQFDQAWPRIFHTVTLKFFLSAEEIDQLLLPLADLAASARQRVLQPVVPSPGGSSGPGAKRRSGPRAALSHWRHRRILTRRLRKIGSAAASRR